MPSGSVQRLALCRAKRRSAPTERLDVQRIENHARKTRYNFTLISQELFTLNSPVRGSVHVGESLILPPSAGIRARYGTAARCPRTCSRAAASMPDERSHQQRPVDHPRRGDDIAFLGRPSLRFGRVEQLLVELLARPQAGEDDLDVLVGPKPGKLDHPLGEIDDADRLAHVEHEDLAAVRLLPACAEACSTRLHGLRDGHEEARHLRVGDGHRAAAGDLLLEARHDASRSSPARCRSGPVLKRLVLESQRRAPGNSLGGPLGGAHDVGRVDRLVGRDHHEGCAPVGERGVGDVARAEEVVLDRLAADWPRPAAHA